MAERTARGGRAKARQREELPRARQREEAPRARQREEAPRARQREEVPRARPREITERAREEARPPAPPRDADAPRVSDRHLEAAIEGIRDMGAWNALTGRGERTNVLDDPAAETGGPRGSGYPASGTSGGPAGRRRSLDPADEIARSTLRKRGLRIDSEG